VTISGGLPAILDLLAIGEAMAELRQQQSSGWAVGFAGDTFNTAYYCAASLRGAGAVAFHSVVGEDPLSDSFLRFADERGIATGTIRRDPARNLGIYSVATDHSGERRFHYWRDRSAARGLFSSESEGPALPSTRIILVSAITLAILEPDARQRLKACLLAAKHRANSLIAFDSNYRQTLWEDAETARRTVAEFWEIADIALPTLEDELLLFSEGSEAAVMARFASRRWTACAIKRGSRGPASPALAEAELPAFKAAASVIDTTAAGDSFNGGYLAAFLRGRTETECLTAGHELAASVVMHRGAIVDTRLLALPDLPSL
jgi:2-dehydro-3-deoxygluconokinase